MIEDGFLRITDRKKDIIVTAGGKNIAPQPIENRVKGNKYVSQAVMIGDRRKFPVMLVVPHWDALERWAARKNILWTDRSQLLEMPTIRAKMEKEVREELTGLASFETPKKIALLEHDFSVDLNFSVALRAFLRQDPDIMLVGEMRDSETVDTAIKAALTGHLVFSTIHTNDSASTIHRLLNMNVEPFLIADSVVLIVAQRLIRKVCRKCGVPQKIPVRVLTDLGFSPEEAEGVTILQGRGCEVCNSTGYKGRTGLFEVMEVTPLIKEIILQRGQSKEIKKKAIEAGMITMRRSGLIKIKAGITSIDEVARETVRD